MNRVFTAIVADVETEFLVEKPNLKTQELGQSAHNRTFRKAVSDGAILRIRLDEVMREQGVWSTEKEEKAKELRKAIHADEVTLKAGGIPLEEGKKLALGLRTRRAELTALLADRNALDQVTAEGQAEQARFNVYVALCTKYKKDGKPVYKDVDDYLTREDDAVGYLAATNLSNLLYGLDDDYEKNLPENAWLRRFKMTNDKGQFIDAQGRRTDSQGRLLNAEGYYVDETGTRINVFGEKVDGKGAVLVEEKPFLDEHGNPIAA